MKIHSKYRGIKGFITVCNDAVRYRHMITEQALRKARILAFWEKHGLQAAMEAFGVKRRTLFLWKRKLKEAEGKFEGLNEKKTTPKIKRKRIWPYYQLTNCLKSAKMGGLIQKFDYCAFLCKTGLDLLYFNSSTFLLGDIR